MENYKETKIVYLGRKFDSFGNLEFLYQTFNDNQELTGAVKIYSEKLFSRGSVGSVYNCKIKGNTISYNKKELPVNYINIKGVLTDTFIVFPILEQYKITDAQAAMKIKLSKRPKSKVQKEVITIKRVYKHLQTPFERQLFIAQLVQQLTS